MRLFSMINIHNEIQVFNVINFDIAIDVLSSGLVFL